MKLLHHMKESSAWFRLLPHLSSPSIPGIKNADHKELIRVASMPTEAFFFYVGDFKLLDTLVPLMTRRVCTSVGGTLRLLGMGPHPPPRGTQVLTVLGAGLCTLSLCPTPKMTSWLSHPIGHTSVLLQQDLPSASCTVEPTAPVLPHRWAKPHWPLQPGDPRGGPRPSAHPLESSQWSHHWLPGAVRATDRARAAHHGREAGGERPHLTAQRSGGSWCLPV